MKQSRKLKNLKNRKNLRLSLHVDDRSRITESLWTTAMNYSQEKKIVFQPSDDDPWKCYWAPPPSYVCLRMDSLTTRSPPPIETKSSPRLKNGLRILHKSSSSRIMVGLISTLILPLEARNSKEKRNNPGNSKIGHGELKAHISCWWVIGPPECVNLWTTVKQWSTVKQICVRFLTGVWRQAVFMVHGNVLLSEACMYHLLHHLVFDDGFSIQHLHRHALPCLRILCILHLGEGAFAYGAPQFILPHFPSRYHHSFVSSSNPTLSSATLTTKPPKLVQIARDPTATSFSEFVYEPQI